MKYEIGKRIRFYRELAGMSQKELASRIGISNGRLSNWEQGLNRPSADTIPVICEVLNVNPSALLNTRPDETQLSTDALRIARIYDELPDEHSKRLVRLVVEHERSRTHATVVPRTPSVPIVGELACDGSIEIKEAARRERKDEDHSEERTEELTPSPKK